MRICVFASLEKQQYRTEIGYLIIPYHTIKVNMQYFVRKLAKLNVLFLLDSCFPIWYDEHGIEYPNDCDGKQ
jgi:hypothetical protein